MLPAPGTYQTFHHEDEIDEDSDDEVGDSGLGIDKRALYEPSGMVDRVRRVILSPRKACYIAVGCFLCILVIALIAAFARPYVFCNCPTSGQNGEDLLNISTTRAPPTPPTSTDGEIFPWNDIRLPEAVAPSRYSIYLHPNLTTFKHEGTVNITFVLKKPMNFVVLHTKQLNLSGIDTINETSARVKRFMEYEKHEQLYVEFTETLLADVEHVISVSWVADLVEKLEGFYLSSYHSAKGEKRFIATTHFEPTYARMAFPCMDEPALKATFQISIVRGGKHISLFNSPLIRTEFLQDDLYLDHFEETVRMSTYLVAFIISDYANISSIADGGAKVSVFAPPDKINQAGFALEIATKVLGFYNSFFGIRYPLAKQDLVAIPDFAAGAMENWGLTTYRETAILADMNETSIVKQQQLATTITHELAHQWFGNLVTMNWWNDLWLNEGFASYMENLGTDSVLPEWKMMDQFVLEKTHPALQLDSLMSSHPISVEVHDPADIESIFDVISYSKGAAIIYMLESFLGRSTLKKGLKTYLNTFKYSNARTEDLWKVLSQESHLMNATVDVKEVMDTWTQQMGFPLINLTRKGNQMYATQQRFVVGNNPTQDIVNSEFMSNYGYKWKVPLTCITDKNHQTSILKWMNLGNVNFDVDSDMHWIKCNVNQTGFYRVTYEEAMWQKLVTALKNDHLIFSAADRASLLDDAFTLSRNNLLDPRIPLEMTAYLLNETDYIPWVTALEHLLNLHWNLEEKPCSVYLKNYIRDLLAPIAKEIGWEDVGSHLERMLRPIVLYDSATFGNQIVIDEAVRRFKDWKTNRTRIPTGLRGVIYSIGLRYGDYDDWKFCWDYYEKAQLASEKAVLQTALGASRDPWILSQYLEFSLQKDKVRAQNIRAVLQSISNNPIGRDMTWRFVRSRWKEMVQLFGMGSFTMSNIITGVTHRFTTAFDYDEVKTFFDNRDVGSGKRAVKNSLEKINANIEWLVHNEKIVNDWLTNHTSIK